MLNLMLQELMTTLQELLHAMMELSRIMSKREFPFTLIFVAAVTGEEQGLYGSRHLDIAKAANWNGLRLITTLLGTAYPAELN
jgi:hypothetical protein